MVVIVSGGGFRRYGSMTTSSYPSTLDDSFFDHFLWVVFFEGGTTASCDVVAPRAVARTPCDVVAPG